MHLVHRRIAQSRWPRWRKQIARALKGLPARSVAEIGLLRYRWLAQTNGLPTTPLESFGQSELAIAPPLLDDVCMPPYIGTTDHDDYRPLMRVAHSMQPRRILELGTAHGNTVANLCRLLPNAHVLTVNAPAEMQTGRIITYHLSIEEIGRVYRRYGYADRVQQVYANTLDLQLSDYLDGPVIDLAIVDACHDRDYVLNDFGKVQPFIRPGGLLLLHDTAPLWHAFVSESYKACLLLRQRGFDIRHVPGTWWALWSNGPLTPGV